MPRLGPGVPAVGPCPSEQSPGASAAGAQKGHGSPQAAQGMVTAKMTSGKARGQKVAVRGGKPAKAAGSKLGPSGSSQAGFNIPIHGPLDRLPGDPYLPGETLLFHLLGSYSKCAVCNDMVSQAVQLQGHQTQHIFLEGIYRVLDLLTLLLHHTAC